MIAYIPNVLTLMRMAMAPLLIVVLNDGKYELALLIFLVAGISDGLDGFIAKQFDCVTRLGTILDPLADKALLVSSFIMLTYLELIPFWLMVTVVFRDMVIVGGYVALVGLYGRIDITPILISKINTFLQIVLILALLMMQSGIAQVQWMITPLVYAVFVVGIASGFQYVWIWSIKAKHNGS